MALFLGNEEVTFQGSGRSVMVPPHDVSRLSYYLNCVTKACGVDAINDPKILDYQHAHTRKIARQNNIFLLASQVFDIHTMLDKTVCLVPDGHDILHKLPTSKGFCVKKFQCFCTFEGKWPFGSKNSS